MNGIRVLSPVIALARSDAGVFVGCTAVVLFSGVMFYLTKSILPDIMVHSIGLLVFFMLCGGMMREEGWFREAVFFQRDGQTRRIITWLLH